LSFKIFSSPTHISSPSITLATSYEHDIPDNKATVFPDDSIEEQAREEYWEVIHSCRGRDIEQQPQLLLEKLLLGSMMRRWTQQRKSISSSVMEFIVKICMTGSITQLLLLSWQYLSVSGRDLKWIFYP
jgi:hypothetical protein